ncbi:MAG: PEP-CTERM sorting domain-containing protein [Burkholderiales bacterium]|nr:MAG: PEP-CTERM sorting domain-containing protein [Burkholderiales bacterium]
MKDITMNKCLLRAAAAASLAVAALTAQADTVVVNVTGAQSINLQGEAGNTVWLVNVGANAVLNAMNWQVSLNAFSPSSLSEMQVSFGNSAGTDLVTLAPGLADLVSGSGNYSGTLDLSAFGLAVGADGLLRIEFSEAYKDFAVGVAEGQWTSGTLSFDVSAVPEPATPALALLGLALVSAQVRRRRAKPHPAS